MNPFIAYDITRLITRMFNVTPNGIDRVDYAFAHHFVDSSVDERGGVIATAWGPRLFGADASRAAVDGIAAHWGEYRISTHDSGYAQVAEALSGKRTKTLAERPHAARRFSEGRSGQFSGVLRWCADFGIPIGASLTKNLPKGARYLNVSQFPLWVPSYFKWLESRRDIKAVFFIHDLLPLEMPEYFREAEYERHRRRLANLARFGAAAIVTSESVEAALSAHLKMLGGPGMPILVEPIPVAPVFSEVAVPDGALSASPYFVMCGTIEPRKNHLLLLHVWREMVRRHGATAPKLVLVGNRGWKYEAVADLLDRSPLLADHVIEVSGLSTPALKRLLDEARALLMPSFAEGFGLPVREALATGTPVIASDIPAFRAIGAPEAALRLLSPIDGEAWLAAILEKATHGRAERDAPSRSRADWPTYFEKIEAFVSAI